MSMECKSLASVVPKIVQPERRFACIGCNDKVGHGPPGRRDRLLHAVTGESRIVPAGKIHRISEQMMDKDKVGSTMPDRRHQQRSMPQAQRPVHLVDRIGEARAKRRLLDRQTLEGAKEVADQWLEIPLARASLKADSISLTWAGVGPSSRPDHATRARRSSSVIGIEPPGHRR